MYHTPTPISLFVAPEESIFTTKETVDKQAAMLRSYLRSIPTLPNNRCVSHLPGDSDQYYEKLFKEYFPGWYFTIEGARSVWEELTVTLFINLTPDTDNHRYTSRICWPVQSNIGVVDMVRMATIQLCKNIEKEQLTY